MQDITVTTGWQRFIEKLKAMIIPRALPSSTNEKDAPQLADWESEGGKSADRTVN